MKLKSAVRSRNIKKGWLNMRRVLLAAILMALTWSAVAAESNIDTALARLGPLEQASDFAGIEKLLRPFEDSGNGQVEYYLAFARMNLAIDGKKPDEIRSGDLQPAIDMAQRATRHGSKEAWNLLYMIYGNGWGVPVQGKEAISYLKRGIDAGDAGAKLNYAIQLYEGSSFVERNVDAACPLFDQLTKTGEGLPLVAYYEGLIRFLGQCGKTPDKKTGVDLILISANHGVRDAERDMGKNYEFGWATAPDAAQAVAWYEKAADHGDPEAQWRLGMAYVLGRLGKTQDYGKARGYFEGAAASGYARAMTDLGSMFASGEGMPRDSAKAKTLYEQAVAGGDERAFRELAVIYAQGEGVPVDLVAARVFYLKGLQAGMADDPQVKQLIEARMTSEQLEASQRQFEQAQSAKGH
jgi:TPR repeat protein